MARQAGVNWHEKTGAWRSDIGPRNSKGRRTAVYFYHSNSERGRRAAMAEQRDYLKRRDLEEKKARREGPDWTVDQIVQAFLAWSAGEHKPRTQSGYVYNLSIWVGEYGSRPAPGITADDLWDLDDRWKEKGFSPAYRSRLIRAIRACWSWAARKERGRPPLIPADPLVDVKPPTSPPALDRAATREEVAGILRAGWAWANKWKPIAGRKCGGCLGPGPEPGRKCRRSHSGTAYLRRSACLLVRLCYHAGCRPGELCAATWEDWSFPAWTDPAGGRWGAITLLEHKTDGTEKVRSLIVPPAVARAIECWRGATASVEGGFIWGHRRGRGYGKAEEGLQGIAWITTGLGAVLRRLRAEAGRSWQQLRSRRKVASTQALGGESLQVSIFRSRGASRLRKLPGRASVRSSCGE